MADNTKIQWARHTGNLWWGCQEVHEGCDNCYAREWDNRHGGQHWGAKAPRKAVKSVWASFKKWQRQAEQAGRIDRVFVGSMMDIFEVSHPCVDHKGNPLHITTGDLRQRFFDEVVTACPNLLFLLLTKRPSNINRMIPRAWLTNPPKNVMYGISVVNQETADREIPKLMDIRGKTFLSIEPLLEAIDLSVDSGVAVNMSQRDPETLMFPFDLIDWVIVGGESGHKAREFDPMWARSLVQDCQEVGVPVFVKQMGSNPWTESVAESVLWQIKESYDPKHDGMWPIQLQHKKGGDMLEWPESLRVRELPEVGLR